MRSLAAIGQVPRAKGLDARIMAFEHCPRCMAASRRCRTAPRWLRERPGDARAIVRAIRWTRCRRHARIALRQLRDTTGCARVEFAIPRP